MSISAVMLNSLPLFMRDNQVLQEIFNAESNQFNTTNSRIDDLNTQLSIDTATWALDIYENELAIITDYGKSLTDRRSVIKSRWRGSGKVDATLIKMVTDSWVNGQTAVTFDGKINVKFNGFFGVPSNMDDVKKAIEEIKPAHLQVVYAFTYLLISEVHNIMVINQLQSTTLNKFAGGA